MKSVNPKRSKHALSSAAPVEPLIITLRGQRVILDTDLAEIYGVETGALNRAEQRNIERFPRDFAFRLSLREFRNLRCQNGTSSLYHADKKDVASDYEESKASHGGRRYRPLAFTEHGCLMAANVLHSSRAAEMSVYVIRAFVHIRQMLSSPPDLARKLADLEEKLVSRLDGHETAITEVLQQFMRMLNPPPEPEPTPKQIGYHVKEKRAAYNVRRPRKGPKIVKYGLKMAKNAQKRPKMAKKQ